MKPPPKPMSSPGRAEKFQAPLVMRFMRSNTGSKSKGRSRSRTMFMRKKNSVIETAQEPSSPKVTCMGQVRAKRSSKSTAQTNRRSEKPCFRCPCSCRYLNRALFQCRSNKIPKLSKWVLFFRFWRCSGVSEVRNDSSKVESKEVNAVADEDDETDEITEGEDVVVTSSTPPKNAFLLTRCRSAPYRSSSLAGQFWGSPLSAPETEDDKDNMNKVIQSQEQEDRQLQSETNCSRLASEETTKTEDSLVIPKELDGKNRGSKNLPEIKVAAGGTVHPMILTRCKSVRAITEQRLNPEAN